MMIGIPIQMTKWMWKKAATLHWNMLATTLVTRQDFVMVITRHFVLIALQSAVFLCCLSISNEGLSSSNQRDSYCVCAKNKRSLLVGSGWITLGIFIKAFDIWTRGSEVFVCDSNLSNGLSHCSRIGYQQCVIEDLLSEPNQKAQSV